MQAAGYQVTTLQAAVADWKMKHFMVENEVKTKKSLIKDKEKIIKEMEEKCSDLSTSLVNQVGLTKTLGN